MMIENDLAADFLPASFAQEVQMAILNALPAHIAWIDSTGAILSVNDAWRGFASSDVLQSADFVVGQNYIEACAIAVGVCGPDSREAAAGTRRVLRGEVEKFTMEYPCHSTVETIWFCLTVVPVRHPALSGAIIMHTDITEQKLAAKALQESEMRFSGAFEHAPTGMALVSPEGRWLQVNQALCKIVGYTEAELIGSFFQEITHRDDLEANLVQMQGLLTGQNEAYQMEKRYLHALGHTVSVLLSTSLVRDARGRPAYFISQVQDTSEKKQAEAKITRLNRLHTVLSKIGEAIVRRNDRQTLFDEVCRVVVEDGLLKLTCILEYDREIGNARPVAAAGEGLGYLEKFTVLREDGTLSNGPIGTSLRTGRADFSNDFEHDPRMAGWRDRAMAYGIQSSASFPLQSTGETMGTLVLYAAEGGYFQDDEMGLMVSVAENISFALDAIDKETQRQLSEKALLESEELFSSAFHSAALGMALTDPRGKYKKVNAALCQMLGYTEKELLRLRFEEISHPGEIEQDKKKMASLLAGETESYQIEKRYIHKEGRIIWAHVTVTIVSYEEGQPAVLIGQIQDISSRKQIEEERDRLFNFSLDMLCVTNFDAQLEQINPAWTRLLGWSQEELFARPRLEFIHPDDHASTLEMRERLTEGMEVRDFENRYLCKDGTYRWISWNSQALMATRQVFSVGHDISERKKSGENERQNLMLQRIAARLGRLGAWSVDLETRKVVWSDEVCAIHDMPPGHSPNVEEGLSFYAPESVDTIRAAFEACVADGTPFDLELQLITKKGRRVGVRSIGEAARNAKGAIYCIEGAFQDITDRKEAEETLRTSEERFRLLAKAANDAVWDWDLHTDTVWWNEGFELLFGYQRGGDHSSSEFWAAQIHPEDRDLLLADIQRTLAGDAEGWAGDYRFRCKNGDYAHVTDRGHIIREKSGKAIRMIGSMTDVTHRIQAEEALRESEERFRNLLKNVPTVAIQGYAMDGTVQYWNQASETLFGYTAEEAIGNNLLDLIIAPDMRDRFSASIRRVAEEKIQMRHGEFSLVRKDGTHILVVASHSIVHRAGHPPELFSFCIDLSERLRAEQELANTNRALQLLSRCNEALIRSETEAALLEAICQTAVDVGGFRLAWVGYSQDDDAKSILPQAHAGAEHEYLSGIQLTWADNTRGQGPVGRTIREGEATIVPDLKVDAGFLPWRESAIEHGFRGIICLPLKNATRTFGVMVLYLPDVRQPLPDELRILRELADDMAFGILNIRTRLDRQRIQNAMVKVATAVSAATGKAFFEQLAQNMTAALGAQAGFVAQILPGEIPVARTIAAVLDGEIVENFQYPLLGTPCEAFLNQEICVIHDQAAQRFPASTLLAELGIRGYVGRRLASSTGKVLGLLFVLFRTPLEEADFTSSALQIFAARVASELERQQTDAQVTDQAALLDKAQDAIYVRNMEDRVTYLNKSAERLFGWKAEEALGQRIEDLRQADESEIAEANRAIHETGEWSGEIQKTVRNGTTLILNSRWTLLRDSFGQPRGILVIDTDITDRKKIEEQFLRAQRMESIGTLAGGIAHDLNNSLTPIIMSLDLMKMRFPDLESQNLISTISASAQRGADMVQQVLSFARGVEGRRIEVQVKHLLRDIEKIANETFHKNIQIKSLIPLDLWSVLGDPTQLHQVLLNLCVNARDAMPDGGQIILSAQNIQIDTHYAALNNEANAGPYVFLQIEDSGIGMSAEILDKIFDPFFTTKEFGHGTGLGLSTSLAIIKSHRGYIRAYSEPGKGTKFKVYLPAQTATSSETTEAAAELPRGNGELILVIDDELSVRTITRQTLEAFGYRVLLACEGSEAVGIYASRRSEIAAVITDMMMPVLDGPATIRVLRKMNPAVRIIGASGLSANGHVAKATSLGIRHFLPKPYTAETLLKALRLILTT